MTSSRRSPFSYFDTYDWGRRRRDGRWPLVMYEGGQQAQGARICQATPAGRLVTVQDQGALNLRGNEVCQQLMAGGEIGAAASAPREQRGRCSSEAATPRPYTRGRSRALRDLFHLEHNSHVGAVHDIRARLVLVSQYLFHLGRRRRQVPDAGVR